MKRATTAFVGKRKSAVAALENFEALRDYCGAVKAHTLEYLDVYLEELVEKVEERGGTVHFAADAAEASRIVTELALQKGVKTVVKSKSMLSEEVHLNEALEEAGVTALETDLGEYILQIDEDFPSPHHRPGHPQDQRAKSPRSSHEKIGTAPDADIPTLTAAARRVLRQGFLEADIGISGANFAVAETGTVVLVENEGNIRFTTSLPKIHLAMMGLEKVIPRLRDLPAFFVRAAALGPRGQKASSYVSMITGAKRDEEAEGPEEFHLLLVDNGRSAVLADPKLRDALRCIRCGACLNSCPVYQQVGGHAYGWVYSGPIGAVLGPGLLGLETTANLPQASFALRRVRRGLPGQNPLARTPHRAPPPRRRAWFDGSGRAGEHGRVRLSGSAARVVGLEHQTKPLRRRFTEPRRLHGRRLAARLERVAEGARLPGPSQKVFPRPLG